MIWVRKTLIWPLYLQRFVESAGTVISVLKMQRASWFYRVLTLISGISNFLRDFA